MKVKKPILLFEDAIQQFYGGVHGLAKMALPFTCQECKKNEYQTSILEDGKRIKIMRAVMSLTDCAKHIRSMHGCRVVASMFKEGDA